jgi:hypothetical protein
VMDLLTHLECSRASTVPLAPRDARPPPRLPSRWRPTSAHRPPTAMAPNLAQQPRGCDHRLAAASRLALGMHVNPPPSPPRRSAGCPTCLCLSHAPPFGTGSCGL